MVSFSVGGLHPAEKSAILFDVIIECLRPEKCVKLLGRSILSMRSVVLTPSVLFTVL